MYQPSNPPMVYDYAWLLEELSRISASVGALAPSRLLQVEFAGRPDFGECPLGMNFGTLEVSRIGIGAYSVSGLTLDLAPLQGIATYLSSQIAVNGNTALFKVEEFQQFSLDPVAIEIRTYQMHAPHAGGEIVQEPYDILATDSVSVLVLGEFA